MKRFFALWHARNLEFVRDKASLSWSLIFPLMLVFGFAFAFGNGAPDQYKVAVLSSTLESNDFSLFMTTKYIEFVDYDSSVNALNKLRQHQLDMVIDPQAIKYWLNEQSAKGYLLDKILQSQLGTDIEGSNVSGQAIRYVDWVLPGIIGMNMMFSGLFGIGFVIVRYRKNGVLKRLKATPLSAVEFISAQIFSRLCIQLLTSLFITLSCVYLLDLKMQGSYWMLLLMMFCGSLSLISVGLMMASRSKSEEFASGMLNLVTWPMMFLSGVWFSLDSAHPYLQTLANILPLTHLINGMRALMLEGAGFSQLLSSMLPLLLITAVCISISAWRFSWGEK